MPWSIESSCTISDASESWRAILACASRERRAYSVREPPSRRPRALSSNGNTDAKPAISQRTFPLRSARGALGGLGASCPWSIESSCTISDASESWRAILACARRAARVSHRRFHEIKGQRAKEMEKVESENITIHLEGFRRMCRREWSAQGAIGKQRTLPLLGLGADGGACGVEPWSIPSSCTISDASESWRAMFGCAHAAHAHAHTRARARTSAPTSVRLVQGLNTAVVRSHKC